jgi:hypothetical protein
MLKTEFAVVWQHNGNWHFHVVTENKAFALQELAYCRDMLGMPAKLITRNV